jgi:hypothetical protein
VRQIPPTTRSTIQSRPVAKVAKDDGHGMRRGLINGAILSFVIWAAAGYLTFILH